MICGEGIGARQEPGRCFIFQETFCVAVDIYLKKILNVLSIEIDGNIMEWIGDLGVVEKSKLEFRMFVEFFVYVER